MNFLNNRYILCVDALPLNWLALVVFSLYSTPFMSVYSNKIIQFVCDIYWLISTISLATSIYDTKFKQSFHDHFFSVKANNLFVLSVNSYSSIKLTIMNNIRCSYIMYTYICINIQWWKLIKWLKDVAYSSEVIINLLQ